MGREIQGGKIQIIVGNGGHIYNNKKLEDAIQSFSILLLPGFSSEWWWYSTIDIYLLPAQASKVSLGIGSSQDRKSVV